MREKFNKLSSIGKAIVILVIIAALGGGVYFGYGYYQKHYGNDAMLPPARTRTGTRADSEDPAPANQANPPQQVQRPGQNQAPPAQNQVPPPPAPNQAQNPPRARQAKVQQQGAPAGGQPAALPIQ